jgi:hypothetical protein
MFDEQDNKGKAVSDQSKQLSEDELEGVSGGLWGITLIDTCPEKYDYNHCCNNFGNCPQLVVISEYIDVSNGRQMRHITCSCDKGYFTGVSDIHKR